MKINCIRQAELSAGYPLPSRGLNLSAGLLDAAYAGKLGTRARPVVGHYGKLSLA